ncbi:MAG TPA: exodeoxyribonuclease VII large subunit [Pseudomonadales bacterium]
MHEPPVLSVSELNQYARGVLEMHVGKVRVSGEISNFSCPASGHWYFTLKDQQAQIRCAVFRNRNRLLTCRPQNGMQILVHGNVSIYEGRGDYQLIADYLEESGLGALQRQFEQLKSRLAAEGLFADIHKKPLPRDVRHIAVITSASGAAIHDILTVLRQRFPLLRVSLIPAAVQGQQAASELCAALALAERWNREQDDRFDALIIGRGGGSLEDLWPFNEEVVARAVFACPIPVVSAVGHETDVSIVDYVADLRAATPSAAAQLISPDQLAMQQRLDDLETALTERMERQLERLSARLQTLQHRLRHPGMILANYRLQFAELARRLQRSQQQQLQARQHRLQLASQRLLAFQPQRTLTLARRQLQQLTDALHHLMERQLADQHLRLASQAQMLDAVSPLATLQRGYSITSDADGHIIRTIDKIRPGDLLRTRLQDGNILSIVQATEKT